MGTSRQAHQEAQEAQDGETRTDRARARIQLTHIPEASKHFSCSLILMLTIYSNKPLELMKFPSEVRDVIYRCVLDPIHVGRDFDGVRFFVSNHSELGRRGGRHRGRVSDYDIYPVKVVALPHTHCLIRTTR